LRQLVEVRDPLERVIRYDWCKCGALSSVIDPMGRITSWEYDVQNRVIAKQYPDGSKVTYRYDTATGRLKSITDQNGQIRQYDYFTDNSLARVSYPNAQVPTPSVTFAYDGNYPRLNSMQDGIGTTTWNYYPAGIFGALQISQVSGPWSNSIVTYGYDALGRQTNRAINGVAELYALDPLGRITNVVNALGSFAYAYDGATERIVDVGYPNTQKSHYDYFDDLGDRRLQRITHKKPDASLISRFTYAYDPAGNITNWIQELGSKTNSWTIGYDAGGQLLSVAVNQSGGGVATYAYSYDPAGNRLFEETNGMRRSFNYNALDQLVSGSETTTNQTTYEWDAEERLAAINRGTLRSEFSYDGMGRRVRIVEKTNGVAVADNFFLWCGTELCERRDSSGSVVQDRLYAEGEAMAGGAAYFYTRDHLGSIREALDSSAVIAAQYNYEPYGQRTVVQEGFRPALAFAGYYMHAPSGLYMTLYRSFHSVLGRWLSRDPVGFDGQLLNAYAYTGGDPINYVDPLGQLRFSDEFRKRYPRATEALQFHSVSLQKEKFGCFKKYGFAPEREVRETMFSSSKGPYIDIGANRSVGGYNPENNTIYIQSIVLDRFESGQANVGVLFITTEHELTHYFEYKNNHNRYPGEEGEDYERCAYGHFPAELPKQYAKPK
jgi:RHS repeat-associated protein